MKIIFAEILRELKASGYKVSARLLNAMYFNVPQSRQRMIFIGVRDDLGIEPSHPVAESKPITIKESWGYSVEATCPSGFNRGSLFSCDKPAPAIMKNGIGGSSYSQLKISAYIPAPELTGKAKEVGLARAQGQRGSDVTKGWQDTIRPNINEPSPVVLKEAALWKRYPKYIHPIEPRAISIGELKRISSFPDDFEFIGKWVDCWARIGNSVPPLFM